MRVILPVLVAALVATTIAQDSRAFPAYTVSGPSGSNGFGSTILFDAANEELVISAPEDGAKGTFSRVDLTTTPFAAGTPVTPAAGASDGNGGGVRSAASLSGTKSIYSVADNSAVNVFTGDTFDAQVTSPAANVDSEFGYAIAISPSGSYFAVGAPNATVATEGAGGSVYVYDAATNGLLATIEGEVNETRFGASLAWSDDDVLFVGAPGGDTGYVYLYDSPIINLPSADKRLAHIFDQVPEGFGNLITISGNYGLVGCTSRRVTSLQLDAGATAAANWTVALDSISVGNVGPVESLAIGNGTFVMGFSRSVTLVNLAGELIGQLFFEDDISCAGDADCTVDAVAIVEYEAQAGSTPVAIVASVPAADVVAVWPDFCPGGTGFDPSEACTECRADYFGSSCSVCLACKNNGECQDGVAGDGSCSCPTDGFDVETRCEECLVGFFLSGGNCLECQGCGDLGCDDAGDCIEEEAFTLFGAGLVVDILIFIIITIVIGAVVGKVLIQRDPEIQERRASRASIAAQEKSTTPALEAAKAEYAAEGGDATPAGEAPKDDGEKA